MQPMHCSFVPVPCGKFGDDTSTLDCLEKSKDLIVFQKNMNQRMVLSVKVESVVTTAALFLSLSICFFKSK